jgi:hypothetical protein
VLESIESEDGARAVDILLRTDGTYGWQEFRRDAEDMGAWTPLRVTAGVCYLTEAEARAAARAGVPWLAGRKPHEGTPT